SQKGTKTILVILVTFRVFCGYLLLFTYTQRSRVWAEVGELVVFGLLIVFESRELVQPGEFDIACGAVALLADQKLGLAFKLFARLLVVLVILFTVYKGHDVGILLDGARFAQVT